MSQLEILPVDRVFATRLAAENTVDVIHLSCHRLRITTHSGL